VTCPHCDRAAEFHSHRTPTSLSLVGPIRYRRAYYLCRGCGKGLFPFDRDSGLTTRELTPALERVATLAGAVADSFEKGADLLDEMAGVRVSESTVERTTGGVVHRQRCGGERVQDGGGPAAEAGRDAMGRGWGRRGLPPPRPVSRRERPMGSVLEPRFQPELISRTTNYRDAHRPYGLGIKVSDEQLAAVKMKKDDFHGEWNYTISPKR